MGTFVGIPPFYNPLWVAMETMHFHIAHTNENFPGVQFSLNWMPGYMTVLNVTIFCV